MTKIIVVSVNFKVFNSCRSPAVLHTKVNFCCIEPTYFLGTHMSIVILINSILFKTFTLE